jgi:DinB superfamily
MIDFSPVRDGEKKLIDLCRDDNITIADLREATNESIDFLLDLISDLDDDDMVFDPSDTDANDPYAVEGEENIGWTLGHLIAHVTASSEEGAAFSSLLARSVPEVKDRPRYETAWKEMTTQAHCVQRLEESRRMRLAYLDTFPDEPDYENLRVGLSERAQEYFGDLNAPASFLAGLGHEVGHHDQIKEVKHQALEAKKANV